MSATKRWEAFWFAPTDPASLAVVRIAVGAVVTLWTLSLAPDLGALLARSGVVGGAVPAESWWAWSVLGWDGSDLTLAVLYLALLAASLALVAGWHARIAAAVVFVALTSIVRANPYAFNSGDTLLRLLALFLVVAPSGAAFGLDARRRTARATIPAWPLRLIQIQVSVMYLAAVWGKLHGAASRDGSATWYATRLPDLTRFPAPDVLGHSAGVAHAATYGTMLAEVLVAVLIWNRRTRWVALLVGVALHGSIELSIRVGFFTLAVFAAYASFLDPAAVRSAVAAARLRVQQGPARPPGGRQRKETSGSPGVPIR
jgi:hypothetical protein